MEADRKRKCPVGGAEGDDWEDRRRRRAGGDVRKSCGVKVEDEVAATTHPATDSDEEDQVEEFFAIVRRMHAAARHFPAGGAALGSGVATARARRSPRKEEDVDEDKGCYRWRPAFEWEDFEEGSNNQKLPDTDGRRHSRRGKVASSTSVPTAAAGAGGRREDRIAVCLDLNVEPEPERVQG